MHALIFDMTEKAVERIQQKRSFFSYKFHKVIGKKFQGSQQLFKIGDKIKLSGLQPPRNRIKLESLEGITISGSRSKMISVSNAHNISFEKNNTSNSKSEEEDS